MSGHEKYTICTHCRANTEVIHHHLYTTTLEGVPAQVCIDVCTDCAHLMYTEEGKEKLVSIGGAVYHGGGTDG